MFHFTAPPMPHYIISGEDTYAVGQSHPFRSNIGVFDLIVVTKGELVLGEGDEIYPISANRYMILRPDLAHRTVKPCAQETHFYWLHFQTLGRWSERDKPIPLMQLQPQHPFAKIETFSFYVPNFADVHHLNLVVGLLKDLMSLQCENTSAAKWKQQMLFQDLLLLLQESGHTTDSSRQFQLAEEAARYLRNHFNATVNYAQMSKDLHYHENYISLCMKKAYGCTPLEYLIQYRMEQAKQRLIRTNDPIGQIAEETGFGTFPYFIRTFTNHTGLKPSSFRQQYR